MESPEIEKEIQREKDEEIHIKKILVPIDGSTHSMNAAKYAIELSKLQNAQLMVIHVISMLPADYEYVIPAIAGPSIQTYFENVKDHVQLWFNPIITIAKNEGIDDVKTDVFMVIKSVADAIINYANNHSVDLIVMGTKGRTGLSRFVMGSVAYSVQQHAHCPVLLVR